MLSGILNCGYQRTLRTVARPPIRASPDNNFFAVIARLGFPAKAFVRHRRRDSGVGKVSLSVSRSVITGGAIDDRTPPGGIFWAWFAGIFAGIEMALAWNIPQWMLSLLLRAFPLRIAQSTKAVFQEGLECNAPNPVQT